MPRDETFTLANWDTHPFTAHDRRRDVVEHRARLIVYDQYDLDVVHEYRLNPSDARPEEWSERRVLEVRSGFTNVVDKGVKHSI